MTADHLEAPGGPDAPSSPPPAGRRLRRILAIAVPAIGSLVADPLLGVVDTAVAGRLGPAPLGALGLAVAALTALTWIFNFLVFGTTTAVARASGAGDRRVAGARAVHAGQVAVALGVLVAALLAVGAPLVVRAFGAVDALVEPAVTYLRVRAVGVPFFLLGMVGHGAFRGVADTRTPLVIVAVANALNAGLDLVLVFGLGLGLAGIAWATVAAEVAAAASFVALARRAGLPLRGHGLPGRERLLALVSVSRDLFLRTGALLAGLLAITSAAARIDAPTAAAHQVLWQVWIVVSFLMDGFAIAGQTLVGAALGSGRTAPLRPLVRDLVRVGWVLGAVIAATLLAGRSVVPRWLTDDAATLAVVASAWWLAAGGHVVNGVVFVLDGVLMGADDWAYLRTWTIAAGAVAVVGAQIAVALDSGLLGLWIALQAMMVVRGGALLARVRGSAWMADQRATVRG